MKSRLQFRDKFYPSHSEVSKSHFAAVHESRLGPRSEPMRGQFSEEDRTWRAVTAPWLLPDRAIPALQYCSRFATIRAAIWRPLES